ncbi:MAG: hypothetical protein RJA22_2630 [Verrucomicrobiota bacterium]
MGGLSPLGQGSSAFLSGGLSGSAWRGFAVAGRNWNLRAEAAQQAREGQGPGVLEAHGALTVAVAALKTTAAALANRLRSPVSPAPARVAAPASFSGMVPALWTPAVLRATRAVNEQTSTVRESAAALGLDVTTPEASSVRRGWAGVGLDVTSPETPSTLEGVGAIGLDVTSPEAESTLVSTGEANAAATSYGVVQATFLRGSNVQGSVGRVSGVYAGTGAAAAATSLRIRIDSPDTVLGAVPTAVSLRVFDQAGTSLGTFTSLVAAGQSISLGADIGLSVAFSAGTVLRNAETTFSVSRTTPTEVDPDAVFNDADVNLRPRFENGAQVTAGSFTVNGTAVAVLAGDSIRTVLDRLNSTVAGVTASFSGDKVALRTTSASEEDLVLGNDTSGFLAALKLSGATTARGNVRDDRQVLARTAAFASVAAGSFQVNGVSIAVDAGVDTLETVLARLNASGAGVTAAYDAATDRVRLTGTANSEEDIVLGADSTGLLAALRLDGATTVRGNLRDDRQPLGEVGLFAGVSAGSFRINGVAVALDPGVDSLEAVLARINASGAGVVAAHDVVADRVTLTSVAASEALIEVADDTTGLLAALGLAGGAEMELGQVRDDRQALAGLAWGAAVGAGSFTVNGVTIAVAPEDDSLEVLAARVNAAGAGVTAAYDAASDRFRITPDVPGAALALGDDTSGFLAAVGLGEGAAGTVVNPAAAFNGVGLASPLFEAGLAVGPGSFEVNGVGIAVAADDTLNAVLARITASGAGVSAAFDGATERVTLTATSTGVGSIVVGNDSSGFLAAVKLDGTAVAEPGGTGWEGAMSGQAALAGVAAGVITVNGRAVAVDPAAQSLAQVAAVLDGLEGVRFTMDALTGRVVLQADRAGEALEVSDTSGLLAALGMGQGRIAGGAARPTPVIWSAGGAGGGGVAVAAPGLAEELAGVLGDLGEAVRWIAESGDASLAYRDEVFTAVRGAMFGAGGVGERGVSFVETAGGLELGTDVGRLEAALRGNARGVSEFLGGEGGLVSALEAVVQAYARNEAAMVEPTAYRWAQARRAYGG